MDYATLYERLTTNLRDRVRSGEMTERGLARMTCVSQPHIHHVLKGKRLLSAEMADRILHHLHIDLLDLIDPGELLNWQRKQ
jgi:transcriptional regulator with XRE-family HTH domain